MNELLLQQTPRHIRVVDRLLFYFIFILYIPVYICISISLVSRLQGRIQGAHPACAPPPRRAPPPACAPLKIGKNMFFWRKIVIFHTKYPKKIRASLRSAQFFLSAPPNLKSWFRPWAILFFPRFFCTCAFYLLFGICCFSAKHAALRSNSKD